MQDCYILNTLNLLLLNFNERLLIWDPTELKKNKCNENIIVIILSHFTACLLFPNVMSLEYHLTEQSIHLENA